MKPVLVGSKSVTRGGRRSRTIYLEPQLDEEIGEFALANGMDHAKASRLLLRRGLAAPAIPEFVVPTLQRLAAERDVNVSLLLAEAITRFALAHSAPMGPAAPAVASTQKESNE